MSAHDEYFAEHQGGPDLELSAAGVARREAILRRTLATARTRRRRRHAAVAVTGGVAIVFAGIFMHRTWPEAPTTVSEPRYDGGGRGSVVLVPADPPLTLTLVQVVPPDPTVGTRLAARQTSPSWQPIDDDALLAAVGETGQSAGLVSINGRVLLMTR